MEIISSMRVNQPREEATEVWERDEKRDIISVSSRL